MSLKIRIDDEQVIGRTYYKTLPDRNVQKSKAQTVITITELNLIVFINTTPYTITNIIGGRDGQIVELIGDGQTILQNNSIIKTKSGADTLLNIHKYSLTFYAGIWYE